MDFGLDVRPSLSRPTGVGTYVLGLVERLPALKRVFIREAAGVTGEVPKLLRGEVL